MSDEMTNAVISPDKLNHDVSVSEVPTPERVPTLGFADLGLAAPLLRAIAEAGYTTPTPVQAQAIPLVLAGGDVLATAQTGTGKTAGFTLPILHRLLTQRSDRRKPGCPRCLILTPTRELAAQVEKSVRTYGKHVTLRTLVVFGGVSIRPQIEKLRGRVDILVATPGRLLDLAGQYKVDLSGVEIMVLDEADRMLDMGFIPDVRRILALIPAQRQSLMFSATFSDEVKRLADSLLNHPTRVAVAAHNAPSELVHHTVHLVEQDRKRDILSHLIRHHAWRQVLVFTRTKHGADRLAEKLERDGIPTVALHGNKTQAARARALAQFKNGQIPVLVATDIASRGLDIQHLPHVVNFDLPQVPEDYVHRIGRTGRAGHHGVAVSLVDVGEIRLLNNIERLIKRPIERVTVEGFTVLEPTRLPPRPRRSFATRAEHPPRRFASTSSSAPGRSQEFSREASRAGDRESSPRFHPSGTANDGRVARSRPPRREGESRPAASESKRRY